MTSQRLRYWAPVAVYAALIFFLSAQSHPEQDLPSFIMLFSDKVLHAVEYAVLGALCYRAFRWGTHDRWSRRAVPLAIVAASLYGMSDELHQWFVPFRESTWQDWIADTIGGVLGTIASQWMDTRAMNGYLPMRRRP
jgi:VanZ family protein